MKGLELSEQYFTAVGAPMIREQFPDYEARIAAGLVGMGSECFGFDDEISRDHDWGPTFCLWLTTEDYAAIGTELQDAFNKLPGSFGGFGPREESAWGRGRTGVFEMIMIDAPLRAALKQAKSIKEMGALFRKAGMLYLQEQCIKKVAQGITSINEVIRHFSQKSETNGKQKNGNQ